MKSVRFITYTVSKPRYSKRKHEDDLGVYIPRRYILKLIESLARQMDSPGRDYALIRFYEGRLYIGETLKESKS